MVVGSIGKCLVRAKRREGESEIGIIGEYGCEYVKT
jgi:hypothetical protein